MRQIFSDFSPSLEQLFAGAAAQTPADLFQFTSGIFEHKIMQEIRKLHFVQRDDEHALLTETIVELSSMLGTFRPRWGKIKKVHIADQLAGLVKATKWKLEMRGYRYSVETTTRFAGQGILLLPALGELLEQIKNENTKLVNHLLVKQVLQWPVDYPEITERALRSVITHIRRPERSPQTIFSWNDRYQLSLQRRLMEPHLFEQTEIFGCLVKSYVKERTIRKINGKLRKFVESQLSHDEKDQQAKDIIQNAFLYFLEKRQDYIDKVFYVDKKLHSYIFEIIKNRKEIRKVRKEEAQKEIDYPFDACVDSPIMSEEQQVVIKKLLECIETLDEECKELIRKRYFGDYAAPLSYNDVAQRMNKNSKTIEKRGRKCEEELRDCVMTKTKRLGLRPY
ncbi:RNA polymerase sigma factor, sigma-70 family [Dyadobacter sp. SG02]|uniref:sigma-70 family RNA polymerase sigma factor n=1 Tax=Dyadobacter sp. SG02 TaxID=1855291 RepID=UPI0008B1301F|nr:sigma-70 family RNA polymerase sigma factor [Dyadobacter sp. SG02]SEI49795.1 RNA polymerase sigma factor, sigma-70 family [Dyadobacter sp. SG02]